MREHEPLTARQVNKYRAALRMKLPKLRFMRIRQVHASGVAGEALEAIAGGRRRDPADARLTRGTHWLSTTLLLLLMRSWSLSRRTMVRIVWTTMHSSSSTALPACCRRSIAEMSAERGRVGSPSIRGGRRRCVDERSLAIWCYGLDQSQQLTRPPVSGEHAWATCRQRHTAVPSTREQVKQTKEQEFTTRLAQLNTAQITDDEVGEVTDALGKMSQADLKKMVGESLTVDCRRRREGGGRVGQCVGGIWGIWARVPVSRRNQKTSPCRSRPILR